MADPFVAEIRITPFNFAPRGWAFCNGQLLPISQNTALFSLLGTTYGGDGRTSFGLPDLRGRSPMHPGQGPGLSLHDLGEAGGSEVETLTLSHLPEHRHALRAVSASASSSTPAGFPAKAVSSDNADVNIYGPPSHLGPMASGTNAAGWGGQLHDNRQPYLTLNFIIALQGVFPPRG